MAEQPVAAGPYVFLSYASAEQDRALAVSDALQQAGVAVWLDRHAIVGGAAWSTAIVRGIKDCAVFLVLGSERAFRSPNVQRELNLAVEENRPLLPLLLEQVQAPDDVRYALAGRQWVTLAARATELWLPEVLRALAGLGVTPVAPETATTPASALPDSRPTNLPVALTSFLGREQELVDVAELLAAHRLLTLLGPGGTGKTRLALQAARAQGAAFPDGIFFVDLAPLADPTLAPSAVARALSVQEQAELPVRDSVVRFLREKRLLLVLDNYEHLLAAAEFAGALLQAGPGVSLLVTSRAPLRIPGEWEYPVGPLPLPAEQQKSLAALRPNPAVALFVIRAQAVRAEFDLTEENAAAVAEICTRLDGLPLAIELAAAGVRVLPPAQLLARLGQRLPLLSGGARTAPARQQTLRDTIAWSYALLDEAEQRLLRRLSVFAGGCTLELAEAVCNANGDLGLDVLDGVSSLLEKSLLREVDGSDGEPRYRMLETIREFSLDELEASGDAEIVQRHLAAQMLELARRAAAPNTWVRLDGELDNVRVVLGWCVARADLAVGMPLFWALRWYLTNRGHRREQQSWRQRFLALPAAVSPSIARARLLAVPSYGLFSMADQARATIEVEEAIALSRALGDVHCLADSLHHLSLLRVTQGRFDAMVPLAEEALALYLAAGSTRMAAIKQATLIEAAAGRGDIAAAEALVAANRALEGTTRSPEGLEGEAHLAQALGDAARARAFLEEVVRRIVAEQSDKSPFLRHHIAILAHVMLHQGDTRAAVATCAASLAVERSSGPSVSLTALLNVLAQVAERCGLLVESTRLLAAVDAQRRLFAVEMFRLPEQQQDAVQRVRAALDGDAFAAAWAAGATLSADEAIEYGLAVVAELQAVLAAEAAAEEAR